MFISLRVSTDKLGTQILRYFIISSQGRNMTEYSRRWQIARTPCWYASVVGFRTVKFKNWQHRKFGELSLRELPSLNRLLVLILYGAAEKRAIIKTIKHCIYKIIKISSSNIQQSLLLFKNDVFNSGSGKNPFLCRTLYSRRLITCLWVSGPTMGLASSCTKALDANIIPTGTVSLIRSSCRFFCSASCGDNVVMLPVTVA